MRIISISHLLGYPLSPLPLSMLISKYFLLTEFKKRSVNYGTIFVLVGIHKSSGENEVP